MLLRFQMPDSQAEALAKAIDHVLKENPSLFNEREKPVAEAAQKLLKNIIYHKYMGR